MIKIHALIFCLAMAAMLSTLEITPLGAQDRQRMLYELEIYHLDNLNQQKLVEDYLQHAWLPALHRLGVGPVGVFEPDSAQDTGLRLYVLVPFHSFREFESLSGKLFKDKKYLASGSTYLEAPYNNPAYHRIEVILLRAFPGMPAIRVPDIQAPKMDRVYELRSYESSGENFNRNKVEMFNAGGEIGIFHRLHFHAVFYAEALSGTRTPNLMYMTTFESMADRDAHWKAFSNDPVSKRLFAMKKYQHNVIKAVILFLRPLDFSQI
ncbi:MAG TPA: NIPSNAP family protein [Chitinophagaceae bacterium]|nr:NIPSNAP family protein [Chitinophagaceae bacterium]